MAISTAKVISQPTEVGILSAAVSGAGPAVLLWPSIFSTHEVYADLARNLARDHFVVSLDPPGHGASVGGNTPWSIEACARATTTLINALGIDSVAWVGSSWGGLVGVHAAGLLSGRIRHLTCLGTPFAFDGGLHAKPLMIRAMARWIGRWRIFADGVARDFFLPETIQRPEFIATHRRVFRKSSGEGLSAAARLIFRDRKSALPFLPRFTVPALVVAGSRDRLYSVEMQRNAAQLMQSAAFEAIDAGHIPAVDRPAEVAGLLRRAWTI
jgi:3-oxoadipate enol-lactonase